MKVLACLALLTVLFAGCTGSPADEAEADLVDDAEFDGLSASSTTGVIRGVVVDEAVRPLGNAVVSLAGSVPRNTTSSDAGAFSFAGLEPGTYFMTTTKAGFVTVQTSVDVVAGVDEPPIVKVLLVQDVATTPYFSVVVWNGFIECSMRVAVPGVINTGVNACNGVGNQDVNFPLAPLDAAPDLLQGEMIWQSTQALGSGLTLVVGPPSCIDIKYARADGSSPQVLRLNQTALLAESADALDEGFNPDDGVCFRAFSWLASESQGTAGLIVQQKFDAYFHAFYNFLPREGWQFSVDGNPTIPQ